MTGFGHDGPDETARSTGADRYGEPVPGDLPRRRLTVVSGPSGVGKSSVVGAMRRMRPDIYFSVSVTTRAPRPGESDGRHYHFIDRETFDKMVANGELLSCRSRAAQTTWTYKQAEPTSTYLATLQIGMYDTLRLTNFQQCHVILHPSPDAKGTK